MEEERKTHLAKVCPHCGSIRYKKKVEKIKVKGCSVSISYTCEKCKQTFQNLKMVQVKNAVAVTPILNKIFDKKIAENLSTK